MSGKGDKPRPVDKSKFDKNFREIFNDHYASPKTCVVLGPSCMGKSTLFKNRQTLCGLSGFPVEKPSVWCISQVSRTQNTDEKYKDLVTPHTICGRRYSEDKRLALKNCRNSYLHMTMPESNLECIKAGKGANTLSVYDIDRLFELDINIHKIIVLGVPYAEYEHRFLSAKQSHGHGRKGYECSPFDGSKSKFVKAYEGYINRIKKEKAPYVLVRAADEYPALTEDEFVEMIKS